MGLNSFPITYNYWFDLNKYRTLKAGVRFDNKWELMKLLTKPTIDDNINKSELFFVYQGVVNTVQYIEEEGPPTYTLPFIILKDNPAMPQQYNLNIRECYQLKNKREFSGAWELVKMLFTPEPLDNIDKLDLIEMYDFLIRTFDIQRVDKDYYDAKDNTIEVVLQDKYLNFSNNVEL